MVRVVCKCLDVLDTDVMKVIETYPDMPMDSVKQSLKIGTRCSCCLKDGCPIIDIKFEDLIKELEKS